MTTQQKALALNALAEISLRVRGDGTWYIIQNVEIGDGCTLSGMCVSGVDPNDAIEHYWNQATNIGERCLVRRARHDDRFSCRWNGFMWAEAEARMKP